MLLVSHKLGACSVSLDPPQGLWRGVTRTIVVSSSLSVKVFSGWWQDRKIVPTPAMKVEMHRLWHIIPQPYSDINHIFITSMPLLFSNSQCVCCARQSILCRFHTFLLWNKHKYNSETRCIWEGGYFSVGNIWGIWPPFSFIKLLDLQIELYLAFLGPYIITGQISCKWKLWSASVVSGVVSWCSCLGGNLGSCCLDHKSELSLLVLGCGQYFLL